jgi:hypothetical protein
VFQYKQKPSDWMLNSVNTTEAEICASRENTFRVEILGKMALKIKANRRNKLLLGMQKL